MSKNKSQKQKPEALINNIIARADFLLEVVDARFVDLARVKHVEANIMKSGKKFGIVVNKIDLVDKAFLLDIKHYFARQRLKDKTFAKYFFGYAFVSATKRINTKSLWLLLNKYVRQKQAQITVGVFGLANSGKSSVINVLKGKHSARTSIQAGFTKGVQLVRISKRIMLVDTPGVIENANHSIAEQVLTCSLNIDKCSDAATVCINFLQYMLKQEKTKHFLDAIANHYGIAKINNAETILKFIAQKFRFLAKHNQLDLNRAAYKLMRDWYEGKIKFYML